MAKNIGVKGVEPPKTSCEDVNCPFHGGLKVRGRVFEGEVVSDKMAKTVVVKWGWLRFIPKFERYEKKTSKAHAHNPPCINAKKGDKVKIMECRPLSKTKKFAVIQRL